MPVRTNLIIISRLFTEYIVSGVLANTPKLVHSVKREQIVMGHITSRALDKVCPFIYFFFIYSIMYKAR